MIDTWEAKRSAATGHPAPFNLQYVGIEKEDEITLEFEKRLDMIFEAAKASCPEIIIIGTSGSSHSGEDFDKDWQLAKPVECTGCR